MRVREREHGGPLSQRPGKQRRPAGTPSSFLPLPPPPHLPGRPSLQGLTSGWDGPEVCQCRLPAVAGGGMLVRCQACGLDFHPACVGLSQEEAEALGAGWCCPTCSTAGLPLSLAMALATSAPLAEPSSSSSSSPASATATAPASSSSPPPPSPARRPAAKRRALPKGRIIKRLENETAQVERELRRLAYSSTAAFERRALPTSKRLHEAARGEKLKTETFPTCCVPNANSTSEECHCGLPQCARAEVNRAVKEEVVMGSYADVLHHLGGADAAKKLARDARVLWSGGIGGWEKSPRGCLSLKDLRRLMLETELLGPYLVEVWRGERERVEELLQRPGVHVPAGMRVILGSARGMVYDKVRDGYEHISGLDKHSDVANFIARTAQEEADDGDAGVQEAPLGVASPLGGPEPTPASPPFFVEMLGWGADSRVHIRRTPSTTITALPSVLRFLESDFHHGSVNGTSRPALIIVSDWYLARPRPPSRVHPGPVRGASGGEGEGRDP